MKSSGKLKESEQELDRESDQERERQRARDIKREGYGKYRDKYTAHKKRKEVTKQMKLRKAIYFFIFSIFFRSSRS